MSFDLTEERASIAALPPLPKGQAYAREHEGIKVVPVAFEAGDVFVREHVGGRSWWVVHRGTGIAFLLHGSLRLAKKHARALACVDAWFAKGAAGLACVQRLNRVYAIKNRRVGGRF